MTTRTTLRLRVYGSLIAFAAIGFVLFAIRDPGSDRALPALARDGAWLTHAWWGGEAPPGTYAGWAVYAEWTLDAEQEAVLRGNVRPRPGSP